MPLAWVAPLGHHRPGTPTHGPVQVGLGLPVELPKRPAGHGLQDTALVVLYWPTGQRPVVVVRQQAAQKAPAGQGRQAPICPVGAYVPGSHDRPDTKVAPSGQYFPGTGAHVPLHDEEFRAEVLPNTPTGHGVHMLCPVVFAKNPLRHAMQVWDEVDE